MERPHVGKHPERVQDSKGIITIILVGMQNEYCIGATYKAAF